jgi:two-component sensor histidine kinase
MKERSLGLKLINAQVQTLGGEIELRSGSFGNEYLIEIPRR